MVLESIINPFKAKKRPWELFFLGLLYGSVGLLLALWVFRDQASLLMVFLTTFACIPLLFSTMKQTSQLSNHYKMTGFCLDMQLLLFLKSLV